MSTTKLLAALLFMIGSSSPILAQNGAQSLKDAAGNVTVKKDPNDTTKQTWKTGGLYNLNFNQAALSNWSAGGEKSSLSLNTLLSVYAFYTDGKRSWDNTLDLAYGIVNTTSLGTRKTDDRIDLVSKYGYDLGKKWYLTTLFNFRTQFAAGYNYPDANTKVLTSDFLAPAYVLLSEGMDYKPNDHFSVFISPITVRELLVHNDSLAAVGAFGVDSGKKSRFSLGAFASITWKANINKTSVYNTKLDLFSDYLHHPQNISIYWTNILAVKVTRLIAMNLSVTMIYDDNIKSVNADGTAGGPKLQLQELIGIGLAYKFDNKKREPPKPAQ
ncbi:MAG TPA: DUF3078 domain-containing protein [Puia sp.]|nr:DUF3078 domain-containing protein [Puia sp.]